jgi:hypothetical protein
MPAQARPRAARGTVAGSDRKRAAARRRRRRLIAGWLALVVAVVAALTVHLVTRAHPSGLAHAPKDRQARLAAALLAQHPTTATEEHTTLPNGRPLNVLERLVAPTPPERLVTTQGPLTLIGGAFPARGGYTGRFTRVAAGASGFAHLPLPPWYTTMQPGADEFAPLADGDINNDGWPDVVVGSPWGVFVYLNLGGHFALVKTDYAPMREWRVTYTAVVDLDGDGWRDLFFCTWHHGCHILWNQHGSFSGGSQTTLPGSPDVAHSAAFADLNRDGRIDLVVGASTELEWNFAPHTAAVTMWTNGGGRSFARQTLPGPRGEALSILVTDLNGDGWPDLWIANDFDEPDTIYLNHGGRLSLTTRARVPQTTTSSMSLDTGDIDNDGKPEIYEGAIAFGGIPAPELQASRQAPGDACRASMTDRRDLVNCLNLGEFQTAVVRSRDITGVGECTHFGDAVRIRDCVAAGYLWNEAFSTLPEKGATQAAVLEECRRFPPALVELRDTCSAAAHNSLDDAQAEKVYRDQRPQVRNTNLLLTPRAGGYEDVTARAGVGFGGWTWDARFADLDNDGWQDLYVTEGTRLRFDNSSNLFYRNLGDGRFGPDQRRAGLEDHVPTGGALLLDSNLDGRPDLVTYPFDLTPALWDNQLARKPGLEIALRDGTTANHDGIGARVEVRSADGRLQVRDIKASGGYDSADLPLASFGLGTWPAVSTIRVVWPDGTQQSLTGLRLHAGRYTIERRS